jgi:hypothetical protein
MKHDREYLKDGAVLIRAKGDGFYTITGSAEKNRHFHGGEFYKYRYQSFLGGSFEYSEMSVSFMHDSIRKQELFLL